MNNEGGRKMKYYDSMGVKHNTIIGAYIGDMKRKADSVMREKIPGYNEVADEVTAKAETIKDDVVDNVVDALQKMEKIQMSSEYGIFGKPQESEETSSDVENNNNDVIILPDNSEGAVQAADCEIKINYAKKQVELIDGTGKVVKSSPIEGILAKQICIEDSI